MKTVEELRAYRREASKLWRERHPEENKRRKKEWTNKLWSEFLSAYGNTCNTCGEQDINTLTVGHLNGDGAVHRRELRGRNSGVSVITDLKRKGWPKDKGIATQCANCQLRQVRLRASMPLG